MRIRLLGLDLDGTALDPDGELRPIVREAVGEARARGLAVVLCTGRRFRTALPVARALGLDGPAVVNNGALVKDLASGRTLRECPLEGREYPMVLSLLRAVAPPLVYVDGYPDATDMLTERTEAAHPFQREYLEDNHAHVRVIADLAEARPAKVVMVSLMADAATLGPLRERARGVLAERVHTRSLANRNYRGEILECFSPAAGKWRALRHVAEGVGVPPEAIAAVGDDSNDAEMVRRAGFGIAMGNAVPEVIEGADLVVADNGADGAARAIERVLRET